VRFGLLRSGRAEAEFQKLAGERLKPGYAQRGAGLTPYSV
jgi:hypothetical protein